MAKTLARNTDLTVDEVLYIKRHAGSKSYDQVAQSIGVSRSTVRRVYLGLDRYTSLNGVSDRKLANAVRVIQDIGGKITL